MPRPKLTLRDAERHMAKAGHLEAWKKLTPAQQRDMIAEINQAADPDEKPRPTITERQAEAFIRKHMRVPRR